MKKEKRGIPLVLLIFMLLVAIILIIVGVMNLNRNEEIKPNDDNINNEIKISNKEEVKEENPRMVEDVIIPEEFYYVGGNKEEGIIISSIKGDDMENTKGGNQFVWVPVDNYDEFVRQDFGNQKILDSKFINTKPTGKDSFYEPSPENVSGTTKQTAEEVKAMYESVKKYKGFYVARFEAGKEEINSQDTLVSKKNVEVWNKINSGKSISDEKGGAIELARNMYTQRSVENVNAEETNVYYGTTTLCYGVQWDAIMRWVSKDDELKKYLKDTGASGYMAYTGESGSSDNGLTLTGSQYNKVIKNIYDLCGNAEELTMEIYGTTNNVTRGGSCIGSPSTLAIRDFSSIGNKENDVSFRVTMYLNEKI